MERGEEEEKEENYDQAIPKRKSKQSINPNKYVKT